MPKGPGGRAAAALGLCRAWARPDRQPPVCSLARIQHRIQVFDGRRGCSLGCGISLPPDAQLARAAGRWGPPISLSRRPACAHRKLRLAVSLCGQSRAQACTQRQRQPGAADRGIWPRRPFPLYRESRSSAWVSLSAVGRLWSQRGDGRSLNLGGLAAGAGLARCCASAGRSKAAEPGRRSARR